MQDHCEIDCHSKFDRFFKEIKSYGTKDFIADKCVVGMLVEEDFNNGISNYETDTD